VGAWQGRVSAGMTERSNPANRGYAICTSGRSGSNLLCQYLSSTGMLGNPLEYFNGSGRRLLGYPDYPDDPAKQIDWIVTEGATPNGIYGLKIFPAQIEQIEKSIRWTELLPDLKFVLLKRRDILGQALSAVRAMQTEQWRASMPARGPAMYDGARIYERLKIAARDYARWDIFFARKAVAPAIIVYEDLLADPQSAVDQVADLFGLRGRAHAASERIDLKIQRDATTEEWRQRFLGEYRDRNALDLL
jgi:trehalose 2-sulfotransferase